VKNITNIVCVTNHALALDKNGHVWAWGNGQQNQLGRRVSERNLSGGLLPNRLVFRKKLARRSSPIIKISSGDYHSTAIGSDGSVRSWGANNYCGTGYTQNAGEDTANVRIPLVIRSLEGLQVMAVESGSHRNIIFDLAQVYLRPLIKHKLPHLILGSG